MTVEFEGDFVVFIIGMKINHLWKIYKWLPVALAMPKMLKELSMNPESGFLLSGNTCCQVLFTDLVTKPTQQTIHKTFCL